MSKSFEDYGGRKSTATTTAVRLSQFLGDDRLKDKGLKCTYVVSEKPHGAPTSERAIPTAIFACEPAVARTYLRKCVLLWCFQRPRTPCVRSLFPLNPGGRAASEPATTPRLLHAPN